MTPKARLAAAAGAGLLLAACGSHASSTATSPPTASSTSTAQSSAPSAVGGTQITITGFAFTTPATVKPGQKLTVHNSDGVGHTVTSDDGTSFNVSVAANGTATLAAPSKPGSYPFHCAIHPQMRGTLVVKP